MKFFLICLLATAFALENGLARTPPMVWMHIYIIIGLDVMGEVYFSFFIFYRFMCEVDCVKHPDECINERLIIEQIDRIAEDGYRDAGYNVLYIYWLCYLMLVCKYWWLLGVLRKRWEWKTSS